MTAQEGCSGAVSSLVWIIIRKQAAGRRNNLEAIEIKDLTEEYEKVVDYVRHLLDENKITESISSETLLVLEALCHKINGQKDSRTKVTIRGRKKLGSVSIRIGYEGGVFNPAENAPEEILSEEILTASSGTDLKRISAGETCSRCGSRTWIFRCRNASAADFRIT